MMTAQETKWRRVRWVLAGVTNRSAALQSLHSTENVVKGTEGTGPLMQQEHLAATGLRQRLVCLPTCWRAAGSRQSLPAEE